MAMDLVTKTTTDRRSISERASLVAVAAILVFPAAALVALAIAGVVLSGVWGLLVPFLFVVIALVFAKIYLRRSIDRMWQIAASTAISHMETTRPVTGRSKKRAESLKALGYARVSTRTITVDGDPLTPPVQIYASPSGNTAAFVNVLAHVEIVSLLSDGTWLRTSNGKEFIDPNITVQALPKATVAALADAHRSGLSLLSARGLSSVQRTPVQAFDEITRLDIALMTECVRSGRSHTDLERATTPPLSATESQAT